jgi:hypothetical protein
VNSRSRGKIIKQLGLCRFPSYHCGASEGRRSKRWTEDGTVVLGASRRGGGCQGGFFAQFGLEYRGASRGRGASIRTWGASRSFGWDAGTDCKFAWGCHKGPAGEIAVAEKNEWKNDFELKMGREIAWQQWVYGL